MSRGFIKHTGAVKNIKKVNAHLKYVGFRSREQGEEKSFFSEHSDKADYKAFLQRIESHKALKHSNSVKAHKIVFSLREGDYKEYKEQSGKDYKELVRETLKNYEDKHNVKLDWVASIHETEGHPHCHVVIKGVSDKQGDRGFTRIKFDYQKDLPDIRQTFENNFYRGIKDYSKLERIDYTKSKSKGKGIEVITNAIKRAIKKGQRELEEIKNPFRPKQEQQVKEIDTRETKNKGKER